MLDKNHEKPSVHNGGQYPENDPRHHTVKIRNILTEVIDHVRDDVSKIDDPRGQALFETTGVASFSAPEPRFP
jgi:hypothetical protein